MAYWGRGLVRFRKHLQYQLKWEYQMMKGRCQWFLGLVAFILLAGCKKKCEENISFLPEDFHRAYENVETLVYEMRDTVWPFTIDTFTLVKVYDRDDFVEIENEDECIIYKQAHVVGYRSTDGMMKFDHLLAMHEEEGKPAQLAMYLGVKYSRNWVPSTDYNPGETMLLQTTEFSDGGIIKYTPDSGFVWATYSRSIVKRIE